MAEPYGLLAEYDTQQRLFAGCAAARKAGLERWEAHTPYPVHGLDQAMGLASSRIGLVVLAMTLGGAAAGFLLQAWVAGIASPLVISGKPLFSWPAFIPITFETAVFGGALGTVASLLFSSGLPRWHHPLFSSRRFEAASNDRFFISVEAADPAFEWEATRELLERDAVAVEIVDG